MDPSDVPPEPAQQVARLFRSVPGKAIGDRDRVHRPGARAAQRDDLDLFLQQAVENTPGEGTMGTAALQRQRDPRTGHCTNDSARTAARPRSGPITATMKMSK
ncbi:hypothetical protein JDO7802_02537 [Jannaschia donghaensis]|uniref:Uncharacterized protein n=1 Tax=Jannaschia donghaensis TaxID=420998 RepID=A0A0M6YLX1_9RHOB|nr:hypothetical protein JDO7802_02537 [Jannaschia donghaensis]